MSINKVTLSYYAVVLSGILMVTTFAYSVILVPTWNWVSTLPGAVKNATSGLFPSSPAATPKPSADSRQITAAEPPAPNVVYSEKPAKPANCEKIIKQIRSGKYVSLPAECEQTYNAVRQQDQAELQGQRQKEESRQRELDRESRERENGQKIELERERDSERQRAGEQKRQEAEQTRAAREEKERLRGEQEQQRQQESRDESARRDTQRAADERERSRQRQQQKRDNAIIKFGTDIKNKIFKKNR